MANEIEKAPTAAMQTTDTDDGDEEVGIDDEIRAVYEQAAHHRRRLHKLAQSADDDVAPILFELSGTMLPLIQQLAGHAGGAISDLYARVYEIEQGQAPEVDDSVLLPNDAEVLTGVVMMMLKMVSDTLSAAPEGEQRQALETMKSRGEEALELIQQITLVDDDGTTEGDDEEEPPEPIGQA